MIRVRVLDRFGLFRRFQWAQRRYRGVGRSYVVVDGLRCVVLGFANGYTVRLTTGQ